MAGLVPGMTSFRHKRRPRSAPYCITRSRLEKAVGGGFRGALLGHGHLQPLDFIRHQCEALGSFLNRQQRQVLPDLVGDFLSRLVVVLDRHALSSVLKRWVKRLPAETRLANQGASSS